MIDTVSTGHLAVGKKHYLSRGTRTEETPVDRNTCPTFSLQTNSGTERVTSHGQARRHLCWSLGSRALGQQGCARVTQALRTPMAQVDDGAD